VTPIAASATEAGPVVPADSIGGLGVVAAVDCTRDADLYEFVPADGYRLDTGRFAEYDIRGFAIDEFGQRMIDVGAFLPSFTVPPDFAPGYDRIEVTISGDGESGSLFVDRPVETCTTTTTEVETLGADGRWEPSLRPIEPVRAFDSRDPTLGGAGRIPGGVWSEIFLGHHVELPDDLIGVVANLTATGANEIGYVSTDDRQCRSGPAAAPPSTSSISFRPQEAVANQAIMMTDPEQRICVYASTPVHVIVDVTAYITGVSWDDVHTVGFDDPVSPPIVDSFSQRSRRLDTRAFGPLGRLRPGEQREVIRAGGQRSYWVTLTVAQPETDGFLQAYRCDDGTPTTSVLNFRAGDVRASTFFMGVDDAATDASAVCVRSSALTHLVIDERDARGHELLRGAERLLDTRRAGSPVDAGEVVEVQVTGRGMVPNDAISAEINVTVVRPSAAGYTSVFPCTRTPPNVSTSNFAAGQTIANHTLVRLSPKGSICVVSSSETELVVDVTGFVPAQPPLTVAGTSWCGYVVGEFTTAAVTNPTPGDAIVTFPIAVYGGAAPYTVSATAPDDVVVGYADDVLSVDVPDDRVGTWVTTVVVTDARGATRSFTARSAVTTAIFPPPVC
jgi:hypothetical protein